MEAAIVIENVTKRFRHTVALDQVSFSIPRGEIFGLLGPNGAGKTTLMRILVGILGADEGRILFRGESDKPLKHRLGYLPEERGLYQKMKVMKFLLYCASIKGVGKKEALRRIDKGLARLNLPGVENQKIEELSKGNQQRIQLLITLLHEPDLLILDEPFSGLDPVGSDLMKQILIEEAERGAAVMISTHNMETAEQLCRQIALIHRGRLLLSGLLSRIKQEQGQGELIVNYQGDSHQAENLEGVVLESAEDHCLRLRLAPEASTPQIVRALSNQLDVFSVTRREPSLHDIFVQLVGGEEKIS
ncbi:MAG: ATP-binding cassette domain-containing protein [Candidatus Omnitrophota bacterium]